MIKIPLSRVKALPFDFDAAVRSYVDALNAHRYAVDEPAPATPHSLVGAVVSRVQHPIEDGKPDDFVAAYEIIDDTPPLETRKGALAHEVTVRAQAAMDAITPPLKKGLWSHLYADAASVPEEKRTAVHTAIVSQHLDRNKREQAVLRHLAEMHSQIHDLTESDIESWVPAPFPT